MKEELVSLETAKLLKEKGFDVPVLDWFMQDAGYMSVDGTAKTRERGEWVECSTAYDDKEDFNHQEITEDEKKYFYLDLASRPTQALAQKWLREKHEIYLSVVSTNKTAHRYFFNEDCDSIYPIWYKSYEEALEEGLKQGLMLIK